MREHKPEVPYSDIAPMALAGIHHFLETHPAVGQEVWNYGVLAFLLESSWRDIETANGFVPVGEFSFCMMETTVEANMTLIKARVSEGYIPVGGYFVRGETASPFVFQPLASLASDWIHDCLRKFMRGEASEVN